MARKQKRAGEKEAKIDKQLKKYWPFVLGLVVLVVLFIGLYYVFQGLGTVKYQGLTFTKEKFGTIVVYSYNYLVKTPDGKIMQRILYLRNDPRYNNVSITGRIDYPAGKKVYISINGTGLTECEDSMISVASLSGFLANNNLVVKAGTPDRKEAERNNQSYVSCANYPDSDVISIKAANETKISKAGNYCYNIEVSDCRILAAVEKFIVQSIIDAKGNS